jgi:hypothetical protein
MIDTNATAGYNRIARFFNNENARMDMPATLSAPGPQMGAGQVKTFPEIFRDLFGLHLSPSDGGSGQFATRGFQFAGRICRLDWAENGNPV